MTSWTDLFGIDPDYPAQTVEQQYAHALADRLEERAERYEVAARSARRRLFSREHEWGQVARRLRHYTAEAARLRDAAQVVREEADR